MQVLVWWEGLRTERVGVRTAGEGLYFQLQAFFCFVLFFYHFQKTAYPIFKPKGYKHCNLMRISESNHNFV